VAKIYIRSERSQFSREFTIKRGIASCPADVNPNVLTFVSNPIFAELAGTPLFEPVPPDHSQLYS
jgi:hypothetical protein